MIRYIKGTLLHKDDTSVIVENNGIGYNVNIPLSSNGYKQNIGDTIELFTSMIVREDDISLYGFSHMRELKLFEKLITVNGVGAKAAISIFSTLNIDDIQLAIATEDPQPLTKASGIGKKTAQRIVLDLKDKIDNITTENISKTDKDTISSSNAKTQAILALESMGFMKNDIISALKNIEEDLSVEQYIKQVLKYFA